jgi:hypothetical protein
MKLYPALGRDKGNFFRNFRNITETQSMARGRGGPSDVEAIDEGAESNLGTTNRPYPLYKRCDHCLPEHISYSHSDVLL